MTFRITFFVLVCCLISIESVSGQYWQQRVKYEMHVDFDVETHQFSASQIADYTNNSPDTLHQIFFHLQLNAFRAGSMMDLNYKYGADPNPKMQRTLYDLTEEESGYQRIKKVQVGGKKAEYLVQETVMEVKLSEPLLPGGTIKIELWYEAQVPVSIRRNGRYTKEGVAYSMAQWYPKISEYDDLGWHPNPYVSREFYGVWGEFDVHIYIDEEFTIAATGILQNPVSVGHGYVSEEEARPAVVDGRLHWHFNARNVHDFAWTADPGYTHKIHKVKDGPVFHFFYKESEETSAWKYLPGICEAMLTFANQKFGEYPYPQYSVAQGGDGGMEYPMMTIITGKRPLQSLAGVTIHEFMHSWYQGIIATNESLYYWMDEGFTMFAGSEVSNHLKELGKIPGNPVLNPHKGSVNLYINYSRTGAEEPMNTHADHFYLNSSYSIASYYKGQTFLEQIRYIVGEEAFWKIMKEYFNQWKFKHPKPIDFIKIAQKHSGMQLRWFLEYFVQTTNRIDYGIEKVVDIDNRAVVTLKRYDRLPMPIDVKVKLTNGKLLYYTIPLGMMHGSKKADNTIEYEALSPWFWTHPTYELTLPKSIDKIESIEVDPSGRMADVDRANNVFYPAVDEG